MSQKTLILLRHAKAEAARAGQDDFDRALAERGITEARRMGAFMAEKGLTPQKILCSPAVRTTETYEQLGMEKNPDFLDSLYNASENQLLQIIAAQPEEVSSLMVIAHNPGLHQLAVRLAREGENAAFSHLIADFPTGALVVVDMEGSWNPIARLGGTLRIFATPKTV